MRRLIGFIVLCVICAGLIRAQWVPGGQSVMRGWEDEGEMAPDGAGGFYLAGDDEMASGGGLHIQRINEKGYPVWARPRRPIMESRTWDEKCLLLPDRVGGVCIVWEGRPTFGSGYSLRAQRMDGEGNRLWGDEGRLIAAGREHNILIGDLCLDHDDNLFITWQRTESISSRGGTADCWVQGLKADGETIWSGGVLVRTREYDGWNHAKLASDERGSIYYFDLLADDALILAHVGLGGFVDKYKRIKIQHRPGKRTIGGIIPDGENGVLFAWSEKSPSGDGDRLVAQRYDAGGELRWGDGLILRDGAHRITDTFVSEGPYHDLFVVWEEVVEGGDLIFLAQKLTREGVPAWSPDGEWVLGGYPHNQWWLTSISSDAEGGLHIAGYYQHTAGSAVGQPFTRSFSCWGAPRWDPIWVTVGHVECSYLSPRILPTLDHGVVLLWNEQARDGLEGNELYVAKIDAAGNPVDTR